MQALVWEAPKRMVMRDWPEPVAARDEVVIAVAYVGICGSELGGYLGHNALRVPPLVMGHEFAGTIVARGDDAPSALAIGQVVTANPMLYCGTCAYCRADLTHLCVKRSLVGAHRPGAFAPFVSVPGAAVHLLPEGMSARDGAMVEPAAVAMRIGRMAGGRLGETAVVIGAGPIGLLGIQVLRQLGAARVFVSDLDEERLAIAQTLGAEPVNPRQTNLRDTVHAATGGLGAHLALDAVGTGGTRAEAVAVTRSGGRVLLSGLHEEASTFPGSEVIRREIEVRGVFCYDRTDFTAAISAIADARLTLAPGIVEAPLSEGGQWFDRLIEAPGAVSKVLLVPGG